MKTKLLMAVGALTLVMGCQVDQRSTKRDNLVPEPLHDFPTQQIFDLDSGSHILQNNKAFLWRYPTSDAVMREVQKAAAKIDVTDDEAYDIKEALKGLETAASDANGALLEACRGMSDKDRETLENLGNMRLEKAHLSPEDAEYAAELKQKIEDLEKTVPALSDELMHLKAMRDGACNTIEAKVTRLFNVGKENDALVQTVIESTTYYENLFDRVTFSFRAGGGLDVTIKGWPLKESVMSTEDGTIVNAVYAKAGGRVTFDVITSQGVQFFHFDVRRSRYDRIAIGDKRVFYQGEMDQRAGTPNGESVLERRGVAKFISSN